jgi:hypothetical protein
MLILLACLLASPAHAVAPRNGATFGIGLGAGFGVSGISGKYWLGEKNAFQGVIGGWGFGRTGSSLGLGLGLDYLWEMPTITQAGPMLLGWNLGVGGTLGIATPLSAGVSGVAGLEFNFQPVPIDVTIEYRPGLFLAPVIGADLVNFSGHVRYHF